MRIFPDSALVQLEFDKVKALLAELCDTEYAHGKAEELSIHTQLSFIELGCGKHMSSNVAPGWPVFSQ